MEGQESTADDLDVMSQFMDVITTFKCKGCDFVCYKQDDLVMHVKAEHMPQQAQSAHTPQDNAPEGGGDCLEEDVAGAVEAAATSLMASLVDEAENSASINSSYISSTNLQQINIQTYVDGTPTDQVVLVDAGGDRSGDLFGAMDSVQQRELFLCGQCNMSFQSIEDCKSHMVELHKANMGDLSTSRSSLELGERDIGVDTEREAEDVAMTELADGVDTADTDKEQTPLVAAISEREEMANGKVSMSTQVIRKKVGRKSKAELAEIAKKENENPNRDDTEEILITTGNVNEPEEEEDEVLYVEIEVPGKRRRRVPKHLTEHYLVPKKTKYMTDYDPEYVSGSVRSSRNVRAYRRKQSSSKNDYQYKCDLCRAKFRQEEHLQYHNRTHSEEKDNKGISFFMCPEVDCAGPTKFRTVLWADFKHHAWREHQLDLGMISCDSCEYKSTVHSKMRIHKQIHSIDKPYICDICHKGFKQQAQLKNHALVHVSGVDVKEKESMSGRHWFVQAECETCKRTFANQKSLQCHIEAVHDKIRPFSCKFCGHKAARKAMMQLHMRTHTGEKPFKCGICNYVTGDHNSLRRHRMRHTGDKPYQCPHCSYACIQAVSLKLHLKSKHPGSDKSYSCHRCPYRSVNKLLYENHLRDHDMGLIDESQLVPSSEDQFVDNQVSSIKIGAITDLTNGTSNITQLIISALNAIAPTLTEDGEPLPPNIETTVQTISDTDGFKSHKISFQIPATQTKNARTAEVVVQEQATAPMDPLQVATMESEIPTDTLDIDEDTASNTDIQQLQMDNAALQHLHTTAIPIQTATDGVGAAQRTHTIETAETQLQVAETVALINPAVVVDNHGSTS